MLTSIHYFNQYRDYVLRSTAGRNNNFHGAIYSKATRKQAVRDAKAAGISIVAPTVQRNKAYSANVMNYITALGRNVVTLKDASRMFIADSNSLSLEGTDSAGFEGHLRWIDEDLRNFTASYNNLD